MLYRNIVRRLERSSVIRLSARSFLASSSSSSAPTAQKSSNNNSNHSHHHGETPLFLGAGLLGGLSAVAMTMMEQQQQQAAHKEQKRPGDSSDAVDGHVKHGKLDNMPPPRPDLPTYTMEQVAEHSDEESMWFSYRGGVYDLTFFILGHPGGTPVRKVPFLAC
jgi:Cytochrome b5-like Heme/Steroid binding domain